jgi:ketosteroid isomerase-like protein
MAAEEDARVSGPLRRYFAAMDVPDYTAVGRCFAEDAVYVRADRVGPTQPGQPQGRHLVVTNGRAEIEAFARLAAELAVARGSKITHRIVSVATAGDQCFLEGAVPAPDGGPDVVFFAHATVGADGLIHRYIALANEAPEGGLTV